jgi:hypothetical protein
MNICVQAIPHKEQFYNTVGDWRWDKEGTLQIRVSKMSDWRYEACVIIHELVEAALCKYSGVGQKQVDRFDIAFEKNRKEGDESEPGDSPEAPYRTQHCIATGVEKIVAAFLGVVWKSYESEINAL